MSVTLNVNNALSEYVLRKIDQADGMNDNQITPEGLKKALENEPDLLTKLSPQEKNELNKLKSGNSEATIHLEFDEPNYFSPVNKNNPPSVEEIVNRTQDLMKILNTGDKVVPDSSKKELEKLSADQRLMMGFALEDLKKMSGSTKFTESQYMMNVLKHASELSGGDYKKFVDLSAGGVMSEPPAGGFIGVGLEAGRRAAGGGAKVSGEICEGLLKVIVESRGGTDEKQGYNSKVIDSETKKSTVTHHYAEFLIAGCYRGQKLGDAAVLVMDKPWNNPGDVRNGYFAVMLGDSLLDKRLVPSDIVKLTEWAYTQQKQGTGDAKPLWAEGDNWRNMGDFKIDNWVKEYNKAFPNDPIKIEPKKS